jgi:GNAT superfamily N-acetyltransferase
MQPPTSIIEINNSTGAIIEPDWLIKAEGTHRQLRPNLPHKYVHKMQTIFAQGGRMCVAVQSSAVVGAAVYRIYENTADGLHMYVDDLITDENQRSTGVGAKLMDHLQRIARAANCQKITLDSGTWRHDAHKFYFREGMVVTSFHFGKSLS